MSYKEGGEWGFDVELFIFSKIRFEHCLQAKGVSKDKVKYLRRKKSEKSNDKITWQAREMGSRDRRICLR